MALVAIMAGAERVVHMPYIFNTSNCPPVAGRKPPTIPDTTQFSIITRTLFGVGCTPPIEVYRYGKYNELYLLHLHVPHGDTFIPRKVLARVSRDEKSRSDISLESEVATMVFLSLKTSIPVPTVYGYCSTRENVIGQPFAILSFTEGSEMCGPTWENLELETKFKAIRHYARIVFELSCLHFDRIGSIYFKADTAPPHCFKIGPISWQKHESAARREHCTYDRGPWKTSGEWLRAALTGELEFMESLPDVAKSTYGISPDATARWKLAQGVLPAMVERLSDTILDPLDRCANEPFILSHMDLSPRNIIFTPNGPNAGKIVSIIDWEMASTAPLWELVCYPPWLDPEACFDKSVDMATAQEFRDTYLRELQKQTHDPFILAIVQNSRSEAKKRFADVALLPWMAADQMEAWLRENPRRD